MATSNNQVVPTLSAKTPIKVKAAPGIRVPMEGAPRKYITDSEEVEVMRTTYYIRRLKDGDLIRSETPVATDTKASQSTEAVSVPTRGVAPDA
jgi:hypothetical protein